MHYNKVNYIHIPKTAGWYLRTELLDYVFYGLQEKNVHLVDLYDHGHHGWTQVDDKSYLITCFRDPVKRLVSHFTYMIALRNCYLNLLEDENYNDPFLREQAKWVLNCTKQVWYYEYSVESFFKWIDHNKSYLSNFQSKNIMMDYDVYDSAFFWKDFYFDVVGKNLKKEQVYFRLGRVEILLKDTQLNDKNLVLLKNKIKADFDFGVSTDKPAGLWSDLPPAAPWNTGHNILESSKELYDQLCEEDKNYIYDFNEIDTEIYNDSSLFWNHGR